MGDLVKSVIAAPVGTILLLAGIGFLGIAVVGNISGRIEPGRTGRIGSAILGVACLGLGLIVQWPLIFPRDIHQSQASADAGFNPRIPAPPGSTANPAVSTRSQNVTSTKTDERTPITERVVHGDWAVQIAKLSITNEYKEIYYQERKSINPKSMDQELVVFDIRLWNIADKKLQFNFGAGNTGLIDTLSRSYVPFDIDAELPAGKCCNYLGAFVLPNTMLEAAIVFSLPKGRDLKEFILSISSSYTDPGSDLRIPIPKP